MATFNFRRIFEGLGLVPKATSTVSTKGEMDVTTADGKLNYHNGTTASPVVTEAHASTLTNKTINVDNNTVSNIEVDNLKAGVLDTDMTAVSASDDTIPSAKAAKSYIDTQDTAITTALNNHISDAVDAHDASAISVSPSGDLASTDVQSALVELQGDIDTSEAALAAHLGDAVDAHDASAISVTPSGDLAATDVQAALVELQGDIDTIEASVSADSTALANHLADATDAHDASAISVVPSGDLSSTDVQSALVELQGDIDTSEAALASHLADSVDAHDASAISVVASGNLAATDVQTALTELQTDIDTRATSAALSTHEADTSTHGVTGDIVGTSDLQTLTNKTIDASSNTITVSAIDVTATDLNDALAEIQGEVTVVVSDLASHMADTSTHGVTGDVVGTSDTQTLSNKTVGDHLTLQEILTPGATPSAGKVFLYAKTDDKLYLKKSDGNETEIGSGAGGGGTGAGDLDTILSQTFDTATTADFTQTGLEITSTSAIHGDKSARLIHQSGSTYSFKQTLAIDRKFRGAHATLSLNVRSTATSGNLTLLVTDETNSDTLLASTSIQTDSFSFSGTTSNGGASITGISSSDIALLKVGMSITGSGITSGAVITSMDTSTRVIYISTGATASATVTLRASEIPATRNFSFTIPEECQSLSYTISALQESGSPESYIDDVVIRKGLVSYTQTSATVEVPVVSEWVTYTPTFTGLTASSSSFRYRQVGESIEIEGRFVTSGSSATEARISLPSGYTSASDYSTLEVAGLVEVAASSTTYFGSFATIEPSVGYLTLSQQASTTNALTKSNGSAFGATTLTVKASVRCSGLSATESQSLTFSSPVSTGQALYQSAEVEQPVVEKQILVFPNTGTLTQASLGSYLGITTAQLTTSGESLLSVANESSQTKFTALKDCTVSVACTFNASTNQSYIYLRKNGTTFVCQTGEVAAGRSGGGTLVVSLTAGEYFQLMLASGSGTGTWSSVGLSIVAEHDTTETLTVPLTSAVLQEEADSYVHLSGGTMASGAGMVFTTVDEVRGSSITVSPTTGVFTAVEAGIYHIEASAQWVSGTTGLYVYKNNSTIMTLGALATSGMAVNCSWQGYLAAGDNLRINNQSSGTMNSGRITMVKIGKLKQVNVSSDQKVEIPTHEVWFENATARGTTDTAVVEYSTMTKIRGDGFSVSNTDANGTVITVQKAGLLSVDTNLTLSTTNRTVQICRNSTTFTTGVNNLASNYEAAAAGLLNVSCSGVPVAVGDVIRVVSDGTPASYTYTSLKVSLQETKVQVALSNVLPQFTESDGQIRVDGANGYGSTNTVIRRFSNTRINTISDSVQYSDSATEGAKFTVLKAGTYTISYSDDFSAISSLGLSLNSTTLTTAIQSINAAERLCVDTVGAANHAGSVSWTGTLAVGDVIRPHAAGTSTGLNAIASFTMAYKGRPNVTSVDVTPFVNVPMIATDSLEMQGNSLYGTTNTGVIRFPTVNKYTSSGLLSYTDDAALGTYVTAIKDCSVSVSVSGVYNSATASSFWITKNETSGLTAVDPAASTQLVTFATFAAAQRVTGAVSVDLKAGDVLRVRRNSTTAVADTLSRLMITAVAKPNTVVAENSTFRASEMGLTRVTSTPTSLGQYRSYLRNASANTYTDGAPTITPTSTNGFHLSCSGTYASADAAGAPSKYEIYVGKNKSVDIQFYNTTGRTGFLSIDRIISGTTDYGTFAGYDPTTGIVTIQVATLGNPSMRIGTDLNFTHYLTAYFDVVVSDNPLVSAAAPRGEVVVDSGNGFGSTNTKVRRFSNIRKQLGSDITYADSATAGGSFTINTPGVYAIAFSDKYGAGACELGITVNGTALTTSPSGTTYAQGIRAHSYSATSAFVGQCTVTLNLSAGDVVRAMGDGNNNGTTPQTMFTITKISN
jgi:hypothetical protein